MFSRCEAQDRGRDGEDRLLEQLDALQVRGTGQRQGRKGQTPGAAGCLSGERHRTDGVVESHGTERGRGSELQDRGWEMEKDPQWFLSLFFAGAKPEALYKIIFHIRL